MKKLAAVLLCLAGCFALAISSAGQTITVDTSHPTNHFVPKETLGAGVDRIRGGCDRQRLAAADSGKNAGLGLAAGYLSSEHGTRHRGLALESAGDMERRKRCERQRLFHRFGHTRGNDSLLLRICAAPPRNHPQRRYRQRWVFAADRWRYEHVLEEQSVSYSSTSPARAMRCIRSGW